MSVFGTLTGEHGRPMDVDGKWELVPPEERNMFQQIAALTHGVVTPANIVTVGSFADGYFGLADYIQGEKLRGAKRLMRSFMGDLLDGMLAKMTDTTCAFGAVLDASCDKTRIMCTEVALYSNPVSPVKSLSMIALQGSILASSIAIDKFGEAPDPTATGKIAMTLVASTKSAYMFEEGYEQEGKDRKARFFSNVRKLTEPASFALTGAVAARYAHRAFRLYRASKKSI